MDCQLEHPHLVSKQAFDAFLLFSRYPRLRRQSDAAGRRGNRGLEVCALHRSTWDPPSDYLSFFPPAGMRLRLLGAVPPPHSTSLWRTAQFDTGTALPLPSLPSDGSLHRGTSSSSVLGVARFTGDEWNLCAAVPGLNRVQGRTVLSF